jgi:hypothetical protein
MNEASLKLKSTLGMIQRLLSQAEHLASGRLSRWTLGEKKFQEVLSSLRRIQQALKKAHGQLEGMKVQVNQWLREQLGKLLKSKQPLPPKQTPPPLPTKPPKQPPPPAPKRPKSLDELYLLLSEKARKAFDQQQKLHSEANFRLMEDAYKTPDGTYDLARANKFFEKKLMDDNAFAHALKNVKDDFINKTNEQLTRIKNSVKETDGSRRPRATIGKGTSEEALIEEIATGKPHKCKDGHHGKIDGYIKTLEDAITELSSHRKHIDDPKVLADLDAAIQESQLRLQSMKRVLEKWNQRVKTHPSIWNADGTSKIKPGWP